MALVIALVPAPAPLAMVIVLAMLPATSAAIPVRIFGGSWVVISEGYKWDSYTYNPY